jgi:hypothetical protein
MVHIVEHGTWSLTAEDEKLHAPGPGQLWNESYYFDFAAPDGSVGGYVRLGLYPNWDRAWYWACVVRPGQPLVLVADNAAPLPPAGQAGLRAPALTADQVITEPLGSARVTLAADAAVLAGPAAAYGDLAAAPRVALALDLEWVTAGGVYPYRDLPRYEIPCAVSGTVALGGQTLAVAGFGERDHSWGERDWWRLSWLWASGRLGDGTAFHGMQANIGFAVPWPSFTAPPGGRLAHRAGFSAATEFGPDGLPARSVLALGGAAVTVTPVAFAPVAMTSPDGRVARFPRAMCRFEAGDGQAGYGWAEWHQPPGWRDHGWHALAGEGAGDGAGDGAADSPGDDPA